MKIEENLRYSLLVELYGNLLTNKQKQVLTEFLDKNISLTEIAELKNTTRQAVNDLVKRTIKLLEEYESKLGLLKKFKFIKENILDILSKLPEGTKETDKLRSSLNSILEVL